MTPAGMEDLTRALGELYLQTKKVKESAEDMQGQIAMMAKWLKAYPADVTLDAITGWRDKFFPALNELRDVILADARLIRRRVYIRALMEFIEKGAAKPIKRITPEQAAKIAESHGREF